MKHTSLGVAPAVIRRILTHLGLWRERRGNERGTAPLEAPAPDADLVYEPVDDLSACGHAQAGGWPGYDESPYKYHLDAIPSGRGPAGVRLRFGLRTAFPRLNRSPISRMISQRALDGPEGSATLFLVSGVGRIDRVTTPFSA
jgi:hypothetical protein